MTSYPSSNDNPVPLGITAEPNGDQYIIAEISEYGAAARTGFQVGDIILAVNGLAISNAHDFYKVGDIWNGASAEDRIRFSIDRQGVLKEFFIEVPFDQEQFPHNHPV